MIHHVAFRRQSMVDVMFFQKTNSINMTEEQIDFYLRPIDFFLASAVQVCIFPKAYESVGCLGDGFIFCGFHDYLGK